MPDPLKLIWDHTWEKRGPDLLAIDPPNAFWYARLRSLALKGTAILIVGAALAIPLPAHAIEMCSGGNRAERGLTCLVDGDTGWQEGVKWRLEGIDTPEYAPHAECGREPAVAEQATNRMRQLMSRGYQIEWLDEQGYYDRDLVRIRLGNGRYAGDVLVSEGLAVTWPHEPGVWCR